MKTQLSSLKRSQTFLWIMIFTFVTVMIWVGLTLFRTQRETGISEDLQRYAVPLNPNIDMELLTRIGEKRRFSPEELGNFPIYLFTITRSGEERTVKYNTDQSVVPQSLTGGVSETPVGIPNEGAQFLSQSEPTVEMSPSPLPDLAEPSVVQSGEPAQTTP